MEHTSSEISRRAFLRNSAVAGTGLVIAFHLPMLDAGKALGATTQLGPGGEFIANAWIKVLPTNEVIFILDRAEMGQGVYTSLTMIAAEELNIDPSELLIETAPADRAYVNTSSGIQITGGSSSISKSYDSLRQAAATARFMLTQAAAKKWNVSPDDCTASGGIIKKNGTSDQFTYGELAADAAKLPPPEKVKLKNRDEFKVIGRAFQPRLDNELKLTGKAVFGIDVELPGMLTAVIIRSPIIGGKVKSFDVKNALTSPGVKKIFEVSNGIAVVCDKYWQARKARELVKVEWDDPSNMKSLSSAKILSRFKKAASEESGKNLLAKGDLKKALPSCKKVVEASYEIPYLAHATMEPCNFTADVKSDACHVYGPTQSAGIAQQVASEVSGFSYDKVFVHTTFLGGGFGRRLEQDYVKEAVEVSKAMQKPVKVVWSREDDMQHSMYRPSNYHELKGGLDDTGNLQAWSHKMVGPSILAQVASDYARTSFPMWLPTWTKRLGGWAGLTMFKVQSSDPTAMEGAKDLAYDAPNASVDYVQDDPGVPLGFWRSVGHSYTGFVVEGFIDEMAHAAGKDPFAFRRGLLRTKDVARNLKVLELAAEKSGWSSPPAKGIGRGIAQHFSFASYVAEVVEVSITPDKKIKIERVVCAVDCGLVINPDGCRAQLESAVNFGLSMIFNGEITVKDGGIEQSNFHDYAMLRMNEAPPKIEIYFVESSEPPTGIGEPGVPPLAAAVANAVFQLTGTRLRKLPLRLG